MRHGVLTVGAGSQSLAADLRKLPGLALSFLGVRSRAAGSAPDSGYVIKSLHFTNAYHASSGGIRTFYRALLAAPNDTSDTFGSLCRATLLD